jgi:hypothetical protein
MKFTYLTRFIKYAKNDVIQHVMNSILWMWRER